MITLIIFWSHLDGSLRRRACLRQWSLIDQLVRFWRRLAHYRHFEVHRVLEFLLLYKTTLEWARKKIKALKRWQQWCGILLSQLEVWFRVWTRRWATHMKLLSQSLTPLAGRPQTHKTTHKEERTCYCARCEIPSHCCPRDSVSIRRRISYLWRSIPRCKRRWCLHSGNSFCRPNWEILLCRYENQPGPSLDAWSLICSPTCMKSCESWRWGKRL
jgi:hypothetical protein